MDLQNQKLPVPSIDLGVTSMPTPHLFRGALSANGLVQLLRFSTPFRALNEQGVFAEIQDLDRADDLTVAKVEEAITAQHRDRLPTGMALLYRGRSEFELLPEETTRKLRRERSLDAAATEQQLNTPRLLSAESVVMCSSRNQGLSRRVLHQLGGEPGKLLVGQFANSETRIEIQESVRDKHVFVMAAMEAPVNEGILNLVLLVQALKLADARRITVLMPYFAYSRQDRKADLRAPVSARCIADLLQQQGAHQIVTVDLHASQIEGFFGGPFENLSGLHQMIPSVLAAEGSELVIVSPDEGGSKRAARFARLCERTSGQFAPVITMSKFRAGPGVEPVVKLTAGPEVLAGKTCVIVDDMIDSGGSIRAASIALKELGAKRVIVCAAHGIFSQNAVERLQSGKALVRGEQVQSIDSVYVTDTQRLPVPRSKFLQVVSIAPLLKEVIVRLDQPQGSLQELRERVDLGVLLPIIDG